VECTENAAWKENHTLSGFKNPYKKTSLFMNSILLNGKMRVENQIKARVYAQKPQLKCRLRIPSQAKQHQQLYR
jgi:hypothetical protein